MQLFSRFLVLAAALVGLSLAPMPGKAQSTTPENTLVLELSTGTVTIALLPGVAPKHVERIKTLTRQSFYDGIIFHRVIPGFMAQTGDPTGTGFGGSELDDLPAEFSRENFTRGVVGAARAQNPNSANSQFFICFADCTFLNGQYTVWGKVISGMDAVDKVNPGEPPASPSKIVRARIAADG